MAKRRRMPLSWKTVQRIIVWLVVIDDSAARLIDAISRLR
jgi:hypothetical protein